MEMALNFPAMIDKLVLVNSAGLGDVSRTGALIMYLTRGVKKLFGLESSRQFSSDAGERWCLTQCLQDIHCPVLLVWGEHDPYFPTAHAQKALNIFPKAELTVLAGCRHAPHRDKPREFDMLVTKFLKNGTEAESVLAAPE
jgi:pimeloyl-ACP methyl ester carboxylesterase